MKRNEAAQRVQLELSEATLRELIGAGILSVEDVHPLNRCTGNSIRKIVLQVATDFRA